MALIKCPECKKKISDQCENCPNCGYPIKANIAIDEAETGEETTLAQHKATKPLIKKWWFWTILGVVLAALVVGAVLFINRDTKPIFDQDGNPVFIELTNEVYTNANKYKGYHINIKGQVFQVMGDTGENKGIQIWLDPETCDQNVMIYYNTDVDVKQGDYISCTGYIDSIKKYNNAYDAELSAPLVISADLKKSTYIDVMAPTIETITPKNLKKEVRGYTIAVNKIEFADKETRVYITVTNNGTANFYVSNPVIIQAGKQYEATTNYEADYERIPYEIRKGASSSGIFVFPTMSSDDFELSFEVHADNLPDRVREYAFLIGKAQASVKQPEGPLYTQSFQTLKQEKYGYSFSINRIEYHIEYVRVFVTIKNGGDESIFLNVSDALMVQNGRQIYATIGYEKEYEEIPYEIVKGADISGVITFVTDSDADFTFSVEISSENSNEKLGKITADISINGISEITTGWPSDPPPQTYPSAVGVYWCHVSSEDDYDSYLYIYSDGTLYHENIPEGPNTDIPMEGTWSQSKDRITYSVWNIDGFMWNNPFHDAVYSDGIDFLGDFYTRIG
ncbi:MAG: DUF4352 domain-containing protein [Oscillospiraceae bacterium]|nr:DUF4352 domain-containing protein [Oscillospiraceae bacterium]